jgi:hypothetical protein
MAKHAVALPNVVRDIAESVAVDADGHLSLSPASMAHHRARLSSLASSSKKQEALISLLALSLRLRRLAPDHSTDAIGALTDLASVLVGDPARAQALFAGDHRHG